MDLRDFNPNEPTEEQRLLLRKVNAIRGVISGALTAGVCIYAFFSPMFARFRDTEDEVFELAANGMQLILIMFAVLGLLIFLRNLLTLIIIFTGNEYSAFSEKYLELAGFLESNTGRLASIVISVIITAFGAFAIGGGAAGLTEGDPMALYIVAGVFIAAGVGTAVVNLIGLIRSIRERAQA